MVRETRQQQGFVSLEVLAAGAVVAIVLLSVATMFLTAYQNVERSGKTTAAVALARHLIEDLRTVPFDEIESFDSFDTADSGTLPADEPARDIARRWRYAVAGEGQGFSYSSDEKQRWSAFGTGGAPITGFVTIGSPTPGMRLVTVTLSIDGRKKPLRIATLISRTG